MHQIHNLRNLAENYGFAKAFSIAAKQLAENDDQGTLDCSISLQGFHPRYRIFFRNDSMETFMGADGSCVDGAIFTNSEPFFELNTYNDDKIEPDPVEFEWDYPVVGISCPQGEGVMRALIWKPKYRYDVMDIHNIFSMMKGSDYKGRRSNLSRYGQSDIVDFRKDGDIWLPNGRDLKKLEKYRFGGE